MMKQFLMAVFAIFFVASAVQAAEPEGTIAGSLVSYFVIANDGTTITQDMISVPIVGYETSITVDDLKVSGNFFLLFEDGAVDVLDQNISIETGWFKIFAGHQEFMDYTMGGDHVIWIDNSLGVGDAGLEGGDDVLEFTLKNLGITARVGVNQHERDPTLAPGENAATTFAALTYILEIEKFSFMATATTSQDTVDAVASPNLLVASAGYYDGKKLSSIATAVQVGLGESVRISLNGQQVNITPGGVNPAEVDQTISLVWDQDFTEDQGMTVAFGSNQVEDGTANKTQVSQLDFTYVYKIEVVNIFAAVSVTSTKDADLGPDVQASEAGVGMLYEF